MSRAWDPVAALVWSPRPRPMRVPAGKRLGSASSRTSPARLGRSRSARSSTPRRRAHGRFRQATISSPLPTATSRIREPGSRANPNHERVALPRGRPLRAGRPKRRPARPDPTGGLSHAPDHRNQRLRHRRAVGRPALISPTSAVPGGVSASAPASKTCEFMTFATLVHHRQLHDYYYCIFCLLDLICNHIVTGFALYRDATCRVTPRHLPLISIRAKMFDIPSRHARWRAESPP